MKKLNIENKKQTPIEWLISQLLHYIHERYHLEILNFYEQALDVEKEKIIDALMVGYYAGCGEINVEEARNFAENYFKENFKKDDK